jgi:hypothetical protein
MLRAEAASIIRTVRCNSIRGHTFRGDLEQSRVHGHKAKAAAASARGFVVAAEMKRM